MSWLSKGLKRLARNRVLTGALRAGAAIATGGLSERALAVGKQIGARISGGRLHKAQSKADAAAIARLTPPAVRDPIDRGEGWPQDTAEATQKASRRRARKTSRGTSDGSNGSRKRKSGKGARSSSGSKSSKGKRTTKSSGSTKRSGKRQAPSGGLDLAAIGALYRKEGKPTDWRSYVKAHSDMRKR